MVSQVALEPGNGFESGFHSLPGRAVSEAISLLLSQQVVWNIKSQVPVGKGSWQAGL